MKNIDIDFKNTSITDKEIMEYKDKVKKIHNDLHNRANDESDFVGWLELPTNYDKKEFTRIKKAAKKIKMKKENIHKFYMREII